jgi:hypothetical protein
VTSTALLAVVFPIIGIFLSRLSFAFAEEGAVPDRYSDPYGEADFADEIFEVGTRRRARLCAKTLFDAGALLVVAGILMGMADAHSLGLRSPFGLASFAVVAAAAAAVGNAIRSVWLDRRLSAFEGFYDGRRFNQWYKRRGAIRVLFFSMNPMPLFSVFQRDWRGSIVAPSVEQLNEANERVAATLVTRVP